MPIWQEQRHPFFSFGFGPARAVRVLLLTTVAVFMVQKLVDANSGHAFTRLFGLSARGLAGGYLWQPVSYLFLHGGVWHLLVNMLMLLVFGRELEGILGVRRFVPLYFVSGVLGGIGWLLLSGRAVGSCIGASGAVFGIMGAYAALFPHRRITLLLFFVLPVTMSARTMAIGLGIVTLLSLFGGDGNIAHAAHLAGGIAGYLYGRHLARKGWAGEDDGLSAGGNWTHPRRAPDREGWPPPYSRTPWAPDRPPDLRVVGDTPSPEEVDRILDKISRRGIGSLSRQEREALDRASRARR